MENNLNPNQSEFLLYVSQTGEVKVDELLQDETVWLTQKGMQELFEKAKSTISFRSILVMYLKKVNWMKKWLFGISEQPVRMEP